MTTRGRISTNAGTWARKKALRSRIPRTAGIRPIVHRLRSVISTMGRSSGSEPSRGVHVIRSHRVPGSFDLSGTGKTVRSAYPSAAAQVQECPRSGRISGDDEKESRREQDYPRQGCHRRQSGATGGRGAGADAAQGGRGKLSGTHAFTVPPAAEP